MLRRAEQRSAKRKDWLSNDDDANESDSARRHEQRAGGGVHQQGGGSEAAEEADPHDRQLDEARDSALLQNRALGRVQVERDRSRAGQDLPYLQELRAEG